MRSVDKMRGWNALLTWSACVLLLGSATALRAEPTSPEREFIQQQVREELQRLIEQGAFDTAIERGISAFVARERAAARTNQQRDSAEKARNVRPVADTEYVYGNLEAPLTLVEYSDFECPFCKRFHPTAKQLVDQSEGKINWVYRHFPLAFHNPGAQKQAEASECAGKLGGGTAFWHYSDLIYSRTTSNGKGFPIDQLVPLASEIGLPTDQFKACLERGEMADKVKADYANGVASGVTGTPGNIILHQASGDAVVMAGALPLARLQAAVDVLLRKHEGE